MDFGLRLGEVSSVSHMIPGVMEVWASLTQVLWREEVPRFQRDQTWMPASPAPRQLLLVFSLSLM